MAPDFGLGCEVATEAELAAALDGSASPWSRRPDAFLLHSRRSWSLAARLSRTAPCIGWAHDYAVFSPGGLSWFPRSGEDCDLTAGARCAVNAYSQGCVNRRPDRLSSAIFETRQSLRARHSLNAVIVASDHMKKRLTAAGFDPGSIWVVPYFVGPEFSPRASSRPPSGRVLYVGRLHESKGTHLLLEAVTRTSRVRRVQIVGAGLPAYEARLQQQAEELRGLAIEVEFLPWASDRATLQSFFNATDALVLPSAWEEPFGIVGLEAMATATPVVAFRSGGIPEWLAHEETGLLARRGDAADLATNLDRVLTDQELRNKIIRSGPEAVKDFSGEAHFAKIERVVERSIDDHSADHSER